MCIWMKRLYVTANIHSGTEVPGQTVNRLDKDRFDQDLDCLPVRQRSAQRRVVNQCFQYLQSPVNVFKYTGELRFNEKTQNGPRNIKQDVDNILRMICLHS